jgi:acyl-CoA hydrolase
MTFSAQLDSIRRPSPLPAELGGEISPNAQPRWLTDTIATAVHAERGTVKRIAAALQVGDGRVYEVADINAPKPLRAAWIPTFCQETGTLAILEAIAHQCGAVVFRLPATANPEHQDVVLHAASTMKEVGEALTAVSASLADGTITDAERVEIERQIDDAHEALAALSFVVSRKAAA